ERVERAQEGGDGALVPHASAPTTRDQGGCAVGAPRAALQLAQGDLRAIRARHAAERDLARLARRRDAARRLRENLHCAERGHRPDQHRRGVLVARLPFEPDRGRAYCSPPLRRAWAEIRPARRRLRAAHRRDAEAFGAAARLARARIHGAGARDLAGARAACAYPAAAVARLFARRLVAELGPLRGARGCRQMAAKRRGDLRAPARRLDAGNTGARGRRKERLTPRHTTTVSRFAARVTPV